MTKDEALDLALEALESYHGYMEPLTTVFGGPRVPAEQSTTGKVEKAITALRTAIEQAEKQDGDCQQCGGQGCVACDARKQEQFGPQEILQMIVDRALEKPAAQRQWVGLTRKEVHDLYDSDFETFHQRIEAKLKQKNGGVV